MYVAPFTNQTLQLTHGSLNLLSIDPTPLNVSSSWCGAGLSGYRAPKDCLTTIVLQETACGARLLLQAAWQ
jgi:hypothetical protein